MQVIYNEPLRKAVGLAKDYDVVRTEFEENIARIFGYYPANLKHKVNSIFNANLFYVGNGELPDSLVNTKESYIKRAKNVIEEKVAGYRKLEAERIVLTSHDVLGE